MGSRLEDILASRLLAEHRADRKMVEDVEEQLRGMPRTDLENRLARLMVETNKVADMGNRVLKIPDDDGLDVIDDQLDLIDEGVDDDDFDDMDRDDTDVDDGLNDDLDEDD